MAVNKRPIKKLHQLADWCNMYLTRQSIIDNFHRIFNYRNDSLAVRFYNLLADGFNMRQIYLPLYLVKLYGLVCT